MTEEDEEEKFIKLFRRGPQDPRPSWAFQTDDIAMEMEKIPLFMTKLPEEPNEDLEALQALLYEGTPTEIATNFKNQGNDAFKEGRFKDAQIYYDKGIEQSDCDPVILSVLYLNKSAVNIELKNYGQAIKDAQKAIDLNDKDPSVCSKANYRIIKSLMSLEKYEKVLELTSDPLLIDKCHEAIEKKKKLQESIQFNPNDDNLTDMNLLNSILSSRGIKRIINKHIGERIVVSQLGGSCDFSSLPTVSIIDKSNHRLGWPLLIFYPPYGQMDIIQSFDEESSFIDLGSLISNPPWDSNSLYNNVKNMEFYYNTPETRKLDKLSPEKSLLSSIKDIMKITEIEIGIIAIYVLPKNYKGNFFNNFSIIG